MGVSATVAAAKLVQLSQSAKSEYVQLEASKDILDRAGFKAPERHMHLHAGGHIRRTLTSRSGLAVFSAGSEPAC